MLNMIARAKRETDQSKGLDYFRSIIAEGVHPKSWAERERYSEVRWGKDSRAAKITKAAVPALNTSTDGGAQTISSESGRSEFFETVLAASVIGKLPFRRIPFHVRTLSLDEGPRVNWRDEGAAYAGSPLKMTGTTGLQPFDLGVLTVATNEELRDASLDMERMLRDQVARAIGAALDSALLDSANSGSAGVKPASITNGVSAANSPSEALFDWGDEFTGDPQNSWILLNPFTAARLQAAARPNVDALGGSLGGWPVATSTAVGSEDIVFLDPGQVALAIGNIDLRTSTEASVELSDSSSMTSGSSVSAANQTSLWQTDSTGIIGSVSANWRTIRPNAVLIFNVQSYGL